MDCAIFLLYEIERGITALNYDPASSNKKIPVAEWLGMMGRTRHLLKEEYRSVTEEIQKEIDRATTGLERAPSIRFCRRAERMNRRDAVSGSS